MATIYGYVDQDSRKIMRDDIAVAVKSDVNVDVITFVFSSAFDAVDLSIAAKKVYYVDQNGDTKEQLLTSMTQNAGGDYEVPWIIPASLLKVSSRVVFGLRLTETDSNSAITKRWTTADAVYKIIDSVCDDDADETIDEADYDRLTALVSQVLEAANKVDETGEIIANMTGGSPTFVPTTADRTDTSKAYVVTANNHLYYYSSTTSEWIDAGEYGSYPLDSDLDKEGYAAESKAVGAALATKVDIAQGAGNANKILVTDDSGNVTTESVSAALGIDGSVFLTDTLFGVPLFDSADASVAAPDENTINTVNYIVNRLYDDGDEFYTYANSTPTQVVYGEYGGNGMAVVNNEFAFCIVNSAFSAYAKSGSTWAAANTSAITNYFTNSAFTIYATVKLQ